MNRSVLIIVLLAFAKFSFAQNEEARYEIEAKRIGVSVYDKDALPRSREFLRLDSTYYVGHMYEGMYKYDRAADYLGYRNAVAPLKKAFDLFVKDYRSEFSSIFDENSYSQRQMDARTICIALFEAYSNIEQADSAMMILEKVRSWRTGIDFMDYHIKSAWTIHRNRYYIGKYNFLKPTVAETEQLALNHLYAALNEGNNTATFYLAILHNYLQNYDSTAYYYSYLQSSGMMSYNNYAHFHNTLGKFSDAIENFERDKYAFDKRLIEAYYFLPTLYINAGKSQKGIQTAQEIITANGSTPGFGWYNIALARSYLYNGQLDSCENAINKAAQFKELHLGTTLGAAQYDFAVNVVQQMLISQKVGRIKFFNPGWWYSPADLLKISRLYGSAIILRYALVSQFANNPERQAVIYSLFSSENVIGFDEVWNVIKDISPAYFKQLYKAKINDDPRRNVQRYFRLFYGNFLLKNGQESESRQELEYLLNNTLLDTANEKLFLARLYEGLAKDYDELGEKDARNNMLANMYYTYPQVMPFSGLKVKMKLNTSGIDDDVVEDILDNLKDCNIRWVDEPNMTTMIADINFEKKANKYEAYYSVRNFAGKRIVPGQRIIFKKLNGAGRELGLRLFGVGGPLVFDPVE